MPSSMFRNAFVACAVLSVAGAMPAQDAATAGNDVAAPIALEAGASSVRIVRLSQARGGVQMDRGTGRGFEPAFTNIPVVAGAVLRTSEGGVAEVEFEDNSTLRLAPGTEVRFLQLSRTAEGATETTVSVVKGLVYAGLEKTKGDTFVLEDSKARIALLPGAHVRLDATKSDAGLAVFDGAATVALGSVTTTVAKRESVQLNPSFQTVSSVARGTETSDWDGWDKQSVDYHHQKAGLAGSGGFGLYGANDLNYYGSFVDMPGCGSMWRPYLASASFDPFANGIWAYYPSAGYSWVSPYPWGWLPFHSGTWAQCGSGGWGWRPGGGAGWMGLSNAPVMKIAKHPQPHPVPGPPLRGQPTLVAVNTKPLAMSGVGNGAMTFRKDSAGLGVPRAEYGNLRGVSSHVERHGMATSTVMSSPVASSSGFTPGVVAGNRGVVSQGVSRSGPVSSVSSDSMHSAPMSMPSSSGGMRAGSSAGAGGAAGKH